MADKVAAVTGGGHSVGRSIARRLAVEGYKIALIGRSHVDLENTCQEISRAGSACKAYVCDITDWEAVNRTFSDITGDLGSVSVLVNNAGGWIGDTVEDVDVEAFRALFEGSVLGAFQCAKAVIPTMRENGTGFILNIGSTSGLLSTRDSAAASTPKGAIEIFTRTLAQEVAPYGIRVSVLHPAYIDKSLPDGETPARNQDGYYTGLSKDQVASLAAFIVTQPENVLIRELVVTPANIPL